MLTIILIIQILLSDCLRSSNYQRALDPTTRTKTSASSVCGRSRKLQLYIENKHFGVLSPDLLRVVNEKIRVTTAIMLYMGDTLDEECFLMGLNFKTQPL